MDFYEPRWQNRNELLHQQKNNYILAEDAVLYEQLKWYQSNRHTLLAHHDHFIFHNIATATIHTMPSRQKWEWLRHLTAAKMANTQELNLMKTNQCSLFRYMKPVNAAPIPSPGTNPRGENPTSPQKEGQTDGRTDRPLKTTPGQMHGRMDRPMI